MHSKLFMLIRSFRHGSVCCWTDAALNWFCLCVRERRFNSPTLSAGESVPSNRSSLRACKNHSWTNVRTILNIPSQLHRSVLESTKVRKHGVHIHFYRGLIRDLCVFTNRLFMATDVKLPLCLLSLAHRPGLPQTICSGITSCSLLFQHACLFLLRA